MTLLVDASALVAIVREEAESETFLAMLEEADGPLLTTGIALWEAALAVARGSKHGEEESLAEVERFCASLAIGVAPIGAPEATGAIGAWRHYGKGRHRAKLNMGDCFAYACAKSNGARLLYKGNDFAQTDLA